MNAIDALDARARFGMRPGLDTIGGMLATLGNFHEGLRVAHVGGTNGKGSTSVMIAAGLEEAGHRVGLYTSPHLIRFHERIQVGGKPITDAELARAFERVKPAMDAYPEATYFECATLLALRHFVDARVDIAVLEVGLGGRLDATNVFDAPLVTVLTNVALEHTEVLGKTEEEIAREKGGIIKRGAPLVTAASGPALATLRALAAERGAGPVRVLGDDIITMPAGSGAFEVDGLARDHGEVRLALEGEHQVENAALALAALELVDAAGVRVDVAAAKRGLARATWPGRLQRIAGKPELLLDGAHNPAGMAALVAHVQRLGVKPVVVFGALRDKDWAAMVEALAPVVRDAVATRVPSERTADPQEVARMFSQMGVMGMAVDDPGHAMRAAEGIAGPEGIVLVTGSLYLVGDVLARLG